MNPTHRRLLSGLVCLVFSTILPAQTTQPAPKFLRYVPDEHGGSLQTSTVTYRNAAGQTVDLVSAIHIADPAFFHRLNDSFKQYDTVLYEMVKPKDLVMGAPTTQPRKRAGALGWISMMQRFMTDHLDLSFQLDEIDYSRPNFVHADLDVDTFFRMQEERGETMMTIMLQQMLHEMTRPEESPAATIDIAGLVAAMQSPDRTRQMKIVLAKTFDQTEEMLNSLDGTVLLTERNHAALTKLRERLEAGDKKIAIFYGAGHYRSMEKELTDLMGFKQVGEPKWQVAWDLSDQPTTAPAVQPGK